MVARFCCVDHGSRCFGGCCFFWVVGLERDGSAESGLGYEKMMKKISMGCEWISMGAKC